MEGTIVTDRTQPLSPAESVEALGLRVGTNWGVTLGCHGDRPANPDCTRWLATATLTPQDRVSLSVLRLPRDWHPDRWQAFAHTMQQLDTNVFDNGLTERWVKDLVAQVPPFGSVDLDERTAQQIADGYIDRGESAILLALLVVTLRCDFWHKQTICIPSFWRSEFSVTDISVDPFNLPAQNDANSWDNDIFLDRWTALTWHDTFAHGSDAWYAAREIIAAIDVMSRAAAAVWPPLKAFIAAYDRWVASERWTTM